MEQPIPSVCIYKNYFINPLSLIESVEAEIASNPRMNWTWAQTSASKDDTLQNQHRTNKNFPISQHTDNEQIKRIDDLIFNGITATVQEYSLMFNVGVLTDEGYTILKYEDGTHYKLHHDSGGEHKDRVVSILVYLNDDYEGGELEFPYFNFKYKPSSGDVILFPSNYTFAHTAHPVTSGTKYAIVSWMGYGD